jgi:hypothetical protein
MDFHEWVCRAQITYDVTQMSSYFPAESIIDHWDVSARITLIALIALVSTQLIPTDCLLPCTSAASSVLPPLLPFRWSDDLVVALVTGCRLHPCVGPLPIPVPSQPLNSDASSVHPTPLSARGVMSAACCVLRATASPLLGVGPWPVEDDLTPH